MRKISIFKGQVETKISKFYLSNIYYNIPEKSEMIPSESTLRFSVLSAVPIEASDSRVSSSDARGSRVRISKVNSSLQKQTLSKHYYTAYSEKTQNSVNTL